MSYDLNLDPEALEAQRAARQMLKRDSRMILLALITGLAVMFAAVMLIGQTVHPYVIIAGYVVFYLSIRIISNWRQWEALIRYRLVCPHCGKRLAEKVSYFKAPTSRCPHCGQIALASTQQLKDATGRG